MFKKGSEVTYTIGEETYRGKVNQHRTLIQRGPDEVFSVLTDPDQFKRWCPLYQISVEKITPDEFCVGTRFHFRLRFRIQPEWDSEVIYLKRPDQIVYQFLNGIFKGGIEIWDLKKVESGTEVNHTLLYRIDRWIYRVGWSLLGGERKHNELTEIALSRLKSLLEETS